VQSCPSSTKSATVSSVTASSLLTWALEQWQRSARRGPGGRPGHSQTPRASSSGPITHPHSHTTTHSTTEPEQLHWMSPHKADFVQQMTKLQLHFKSLSTYYN